jgi:hypothetical protein
MPVSVRPTGVWRTVGVTDFLTGASAFAGAKVQAARSNKAGEARDAVRCRREERGMVCEVILSLLALRARGRPKMLMEEFKFEVKS